MPARDLATSIIRRNAAFGWDEPRHLGCIETGTGPNSAGAEFSPSLVTTHEGTYLYFSSTVSGNHDIYRSRRGSDGEFGPPTPVHELNTDFNDRMPNISKDGLEIVFSSTRPTDAEGSAAFGSFDVYVSTRHHQSTIRRGGQPGLAISAAQRGSGCSAFRKGDTPISSCRCRTWVDANIGSLSSWFLIS